MSRRQLERDFAQTCERLADTHGKLQTAHAFLISLLALSGGEAEVSDELVRTSVAANTAFTVERRSGGFVLKHVPRDQMPEPTPRREPDFAGGVQ